MIAAEMTARNKGTIDRTVFSLSYLTSIRNSNYVEI